MLEPLAAVRDDLVKKWLANCPQEVAIANGHVYNIAEHHTAWWFHDGSYADEMPVLLVRAQERLMDAIREGAE